MKGKMEDIKVEPVFACINFFNNILMFSFYQNYTLFFGGQKLYTVLIIFSGDR